MNNMKLKINSIILFVSILATLVGCTAQPTVAPTEVPTEVPATAAPTEVPTTGDEIILTTGDYPPYVFEGADDPGPMAAIVAAAFKEEGITTKIVFYPWKRAEDEARQGNAFAAFPYTVTEERKKEFEFSDPMYLVTAKFFYNKEYHSDGMPFEQVEDLCDYKLGGLAGSWYEESFFKDAGVQVEYVSEIEQNIEKLARGRIDLMVGEQNVLWYLIRTKYSDEASKFATLEKPLERPGGVANDFRLMVSPNYPNYAELLDKYNAGLAAIRANGTYKQILEKYQLAVQP